MHAAWSFEAGATMVPESDDGCIVTCISVKLIIGRQLLHHRPQFVNRQRFITAFTDLLQQHILYLIFYRLLYLSASLIMLFLHHNYRRQSAVFLISDDSFQLR